MISKILNKMSIKQKLFTLCFLMSLPTIALLSIYVKNLNDGIEFTRIERAGAEYIHPGTMHLYTALVNHRSYYNVFFVGGPNVFPGKISETESQINKGFDELEKQIAIYHKDVDVSSEFKQLKQDWQTLQQENAKITQSASLIRHSKLIKDVAFFVAKVAEKSGMALDPQAVSYYTINIATEKLFKLLDRQGRIRSLSFEVQSDPAKASDQVKSIIFGAADDIKDLKIFINDGYNVILNADPTLKAEIQPELDKLNVGIDDIAQMANEVLSQTFKGSPEDVFMRGHKVVTQAGDFLNLAMESLDTTLDNRVAHDTRARNLSLAFGLGIMGLVFFFAFVMQRRIQLAIKTLEQGFKNIENRELNNVLPVVSQDELGQSIIALNSVTAMLAKSTHEIDEKNKIAARFIQALNACDTPVMMADKDFNIIFMNENVKKMLEKREKQLQSVLPIFRMDKLMGASIDQFHKVPSHQRNLISGLKGSHKTELKLAGLTFGLIATPLFSENNEFLGAVVEWLDKTEALEIQNKERMIAEDNARVKQALDNVTSNTMIADINYNIVYMNHSLKKMLGDAEADIRKVLTSFDAKTLMGRNMDVFHRSPQHQRALMDNLKAAHKTELSIGGRTLALIASPVNDETGKRIGSVVEWLDRTQEAGIEKEIGELVGSASKGDLTSRLSERGRDGFFLRLSQGLNQLVGVMEHVVEDTTRVLAALSHGKLTETIDSDYQGAFLKLKNDANNTVDRLTETISSIRQISREVSSGAQEIAQGNADLSQRTEEQASSLEETASSMEQMTATVKQTAENAQSAKALAVIAKDTAQHGGNVVSEAVTAMSGINESSKKIADIIGVIDEIAFQTNLLALNAAVEAARAGDQGRGFAVVAGEVRNLAQRSAAAAKEIKELIRDSVGKVQNGTELVNKSGTTLNEIMKSVEKVAGTVAEISNAAQEQRSGIEQVNTAITQMDTMTQQNSALVEEASAASEAMAGQAKKLLEMVSFFTLSAEDEKMVASAGGASSRSKANAGGKSGASRKSSKVMKPNEGQDEWSEF